MDASEKFCLTWNDFESNISASFKEMRKEEDFFDVTLACEDDSQLEAHKVVLSACSKFFQKILRKNKHQHPLLYLKGVKYSQLESILSFMYHGETSIGQNDLTAFLSVAEELQVKGLTQKEDKSSSSNANSCSNSSKKSNKQTKKNEAAKLNKINPEDDDDDIQEIQQENNIKTDQNEVVDVESEFQDGTGSIEDSYGYYYQGYDGMVSTGSMDTDYQNNLSSLEQYGKVCRLFHLNFLSIYYRITRPE